MKKQFYPTSNFLKHDRKLQCLRLLFLYAPIALISNKRQKQLIYKL